MKSNLGGIHFHTGFTPATPLLVERICHWCLKYSWKIMWYHDTERYSLIDNNKLGKNGIVLLSCTICDFLLKILIWKLLYNPIHKIMCGEYLTFILSMCLQTWKNTKIIFIHSNIFVLMAKTKIAIVYHLVLVMVSVCFWNILKIFAKISCFK